MSKNSDRMQNFSLGVAVEDSAPKSNFSKLSELSEASKTRKLILGLLVNIEFEINQPYHV